MPKNKLGDLRNHLFAQLERLQDEEIQGEKLTDEVKRSKAMCGITKQVIDSAKVEVDFIRVYGGSGSGFISIDPPKETQKKIDA